MWCKFVKRREGRQKQKKAKKITKQERKDKDRGELR